MRYFCARQLYNMPFPTVPLLDWNCFTVYHLKMSNDFTHSVLSWVNIQRLEKFEKIICNHSFLILIVERILQKMLGNYCLHARAN